jgi:hypothetical protein
VGKRSREKSDTSDKKNTENSVIEETVPKKFLRLRQDSGSDTD